MKRLTVLALAAIAVPAFADVTITAPAPNLKLESPFNLIATASPCSGQSIASMGYSFDSQSNTTIFSNVSSINVSASYSGLTLNATHTLHVKSWGSSGASCHTDVSFTAVANPTTTVPQNAVTVSGIQSNQNYTWKADYDTGTGGTNSSGTSGTTQLATSPSLSGDSRQFFTNYVDYGGERYYTSFGSDANAQNFLYDTWVYVSSATSSGGLANLEFDMNQVTSNGQTVIYGFQCDGWQGTWDYTENSGTASSPVDKWVYSTQPCNPANWATNMWHHLQVTYSRDANGNVTYHSVWFDGVEQDINATVFSSFALGWSPTLLTNFQTDGKTSGTGTIEAYLDNLTVTRW